MAVKQFITLKDGEFTNRDPGMVRLLFGLGLGFFRHRLADGAFQWSEPGLLRHPKQQIEELVRAVVG